MERSRHVVLCSRKWLSSISPGHWKPMTTKAANRAAVHGAKLPIPDILDKEEVDRVIQKAKEEKEAKRKQIEKTVESHTNHPSKSDHPSAD